MSTHGDPHLEMETSRFGPCRDTGTVLVRSTADSRSHIESGERETRNRSMVKMADSP